MDEHNSFQLKGIDPPDALEEDLSAKTIRCTDFKYNTVPPRSYSENTSKEELVLEHVLEYKR